jgi:amino acid transporter
MQKSGNPVSFSAAVAMGVGAMVGAGIFALLGQAGAIAGSAVYLSFLAGGIIALLSGYSLGKLGARFPSSGGMVEYLVQGYGVGIFSGSMSVMMYLSALVSVSLVARTFGVYAASFFPAHLSVLLTHGFAAGIILVFMLVNLDGPKSASWVETAVVAVKMTVLVLFAAAGLLYVQPALLSPSTYPPATTVFYSLAITFFAYEGFRVITNAAEDMDNPQRMLPRAIMTAVAVVILLYIAIALAVFGNMPADRVIAAKDLALATAAKPVFGEAGFRVVALAALFSTASAINAALYAITNVTYQLAKVGELPAAFGRPIGHSREGLLISSALILILALFFDLSEIAAIGSVSILIVHCVVHAGHFRLLRETGASLLLVALAMSSNLAAIVLSAHYLAGKAPHLLGFIAGLIALALLIELSLRFWTGRRVRPRIDPVANAGQGPVGDS